MVWVREVGLNLELLSRSSIGYQRPNETANYRMATPDDYLNGRPEPEPEAFLRPPPLLSFGIIISPLF